jgi:hypothetical protein
MPRVLLAATLMALWPALAAGQTPPTLAPVPPLPPIGLPLPEISGSDRPVGWTGRQQPPSRDEAKDPPRRKPGKHRRGGRSSPIFFVPVYVPYPSNGVAAAPPYRHTPEPAPAVSGQAQAPAEQAEEREEREKIEAERQAAELAAQREAAAENEKKTERPPDPPPPPSTFYYIPGCYMGNVPPDDVELPKGCDRSKLVVRKP